MSIKMNYTFLTDQDYNNLIKPFDLIYGKFSHEFGECWLAYTTTNQLCFCAFTTDDTIKTNINAIYHRSKLIRDDQAIINHKIQQICLKGTPFQLRVWQTLLHIPMGETVTYANVANMIGQPKAVRAVANAIAHNNIAWYIPCHRVQATSTSAPIKYRWGSEIKLKMQQKEQSIH